MEWDMTAAQPEIVKAHCNKCLGWKNLQVLHREVTSWSETIDERHGISIHGGDTWILFKCLGCDELRLNHSSWFSEDTDDDGRPTVTTEWFPPSITRQKPIWRRNLFPFNAKLYELNGLTDEIYGALGIGAHRIATMGIRALAERVMVDQVGEKGTFQKTTKAFFDAGFVAPFQQGMFENTLIEAGHAAMHRSFEPTADTVNTLLDIIEGVLHAIYYQPMLAAEAKKTIPNRSKPQP
jgi:hypothetical protein